MTGRRDLWERIASALDRLAPPVAAPVDWLSHCAYVWDGGSARPIVALETVGLAKLRGIDEQKSAILANLKRLAAGAAAHDMLLWGSRGMGKSALIRAAIDELASGDDGGVALVQITSGSLPRIADLLVELGGQERAFLLYLDDLGFDSGAAQDNLALRSLLDGGVMARPANVRLAVTSNRRAIVARDWDESNARHERDERDNALALADRFGLTLGFHPCDQETYLEILRAYTDPLDIEVDEEEALRWTIARGSRSGRSAYQYACELAGRAGLKL
ncbi:DUF815 domain-containing protein [uncultured Erythrobacter sp.]|uniref:DUF815 domain-containing protein n=1 Tax=uncultured Erythrobacter sp. TaxID=263913 RepID=UPI002631441A|nr:DUF815 domain-containing protein [uncultured Erythrobacter sp.]